MSITDGFGFESNEEVKGDGATPFLKGSDFDGEGQVLEVIGMEVFTPKLGKNGEDFGVKNTYGKGGVLEKENYLLKAGVLKEEGQALKYTFKQEGVDKFFTNNSVSFFFAVNNAKLETGDIVTIKRNKISNTNVQWSIIKK